jgi:hypothetical protein
MITGFLDLWSISPSARTDVYTLTQVTKLFISHNGYNTMAYLLREKQTIFKSKFHLFSNDLNDQENNSVALEGLVHKVIESTLFPANIVYLTYTAEEKERYRTDPAYRESQMKVLGKDRPHDPNTLLGIPKQN